MDIAEKKTNIQSDIDSNLENVDSKLNVKVWPIVRNNYQKNALDACKSGDHYRTVLYESKALSCGFVGERLNDCGEKINELSIGNTIHLQQNSKNDLTGFLSACVIDNKITKSSTKKFTIEIDDRMQFDDLCTKCSQLPKQWNVLQIR